MKPENKPAAVEKFMAFMRGNPVRGAVNIRQFIEQGRASAEAFKKISTEVLANRPKPKKGESIVHELNESRSRGGKLR